MFGLWTHLTKGTACTVVLFYTSVFHSGPPGGDVGASESWKEDDEKNEKNKNK